MEYMENTVKDINNIIPKILHLDDTNFFTQYIHNIIIVVILIIATVFLDSKAHKKISDVNNVTIESFSFGLLITLITLFSLSFLIKNNTLEVNIIWNTVITLSAIVIMFIYFTYTNKDILFPDKKTNLLYPNTTEGAIFITFIVILGLITISVISNSVFNKNLLSFIPYLFNIGFIFSFIVWCCKPIFDKFIYPFVTGKTVMSTETSVAQYDKPNTISKIMQDLFADGEIKKYGALFSVIIFLFVILSIAEFDPTALTNKNYVYAACVIIPLIFIVSTIMNLNQSMIYPAIGLAIIFFIIMLYNYSSLSIQSFTSISYVVNFIIGCMILVALSIVFFMFSNYLKSIGGWLGVIVYFIFYIPCLLIDFVQYIKREIALTTNSIFILLAIELLLVLVYYSIPKLKNLMHTNGIILLNDSMFLDSYQVIGNSDQFKAPVMDPLDLISSRYVYNQNYALSMWIYLNSEPQNNLAYSKETVIFDYGEGKPQIAYFNNTNELDTMHEKDKYIVYFTNKIDDADPGSSSYQISLPSQKWNHFVFNYSSTKVDLYLNGSLEYTYNFTNNSPTYSVGDVVSVGSDNGLNGAICNVRYFNQPLSSQKIATMYNLLMYSNPPTIIL